MKKVFSSSLSIIIVAVMLLSFVPFVTVANGALHSPSNDYQWPVDVAKGSWVRGFLSSHKGIDISANVGTPVKAVCGGTLICASTASKSANAFCKTCQQGGSGYHVTVKQDDGRIACYCHLNTVDVKLEKNKTVRINKGQKIGAVGKTGNAEGPHLHLTLTKVTGLKYIKDNEKIDPLTLLTPWCKIEESNITNNSAKITATFGAKKMTIEKYSISFGTSIDEKQFKTYETNKKADRNNIVFDLGTKQYGGALKNATRYYYRIRCSRNGATYKSPLYCFDITAPVSSAKYDISTKTVTGKDISVASFIKITHNGKTLVNGTDYTLSRTTVKAIGKYDITVKGKGLYTGSVTKTITVLPKSPGSVSLKKVFALNRVSVSYAKIADCTGYEVQISKSADFKDAYTVKEPQKNDAMSFAKVKFGNSKEEKLRSGVTYYVRVRSYKTVDYKKTCVNLYGKWSSTNKIKY